MDNAELAALWARTTGSMNSTFNCLFFAKKTRLYAARGSKLSEAWKYVEESNVALSKVDNQTTIRYEEKEKDDKPWRINRPNKWN